MVFPLYDHNPLKLPVPPVVTWGLIAANVIVFLIQQGAGDGGYQAMLDYGVVPSAITGGAPYDGPLPAVATLITGMFLHEGWEHILGNMVFLWVFGDDIEEALGPVKFLAFYLLSGIAASLAFVAFNSDSSAPLVGASGAIAGVLSAYLMLRPCAKILVFFFCVVVRIKAVYVIGVWALLQIIDLAGKTDDQVAYMAHIGGMIAGAVLFLVMRPKSIELFECMSYSEEA